ATIKNKTKNHKMQAVFILEDNIDVSCGFNSTGYIKRCHDFNYDIKKYMPLKYVDKIELKNNINPTKDCVFAKDFLLLSKGIPEYEVYKNELKIPLLRAVGLISNPRNPARAIPAGPALEIPDAQMLGIFEVEFGVCFSTFDKTFELQEHFWQNYVTIEGMFEDPIDLKLLSNFKNHFWGIINNKGIFYNPCENTVELRSVE
ncbi:hypothetical protein IJ670_08410, partial [bacterium]|nr:hypothetical protein [bacterium]